MYCGSDERYLGLAIQLQVDANGRGEVVDAVGFGAGDGDAAGRRLAVVRRRRLIALRVVSVAVQVDEIFRVAAQQNEIG